MGNKLKGISNRRKWVWSSETFQKPTLSFFHVPPAQNKTLLQNNRETQKSLDYDYIVLMFCEI